jgi:hypothetical protein
VNTDDNGWLEHRAPFDLLTAQSAEQILSWDDRAVADLARSLAEEGPAAAAAAIPLLDEAAARADSAQDAGAAEGLRRTRAALTHR